MLNTKSNQSQDFLLMHNHIIKVINFIVIIFLALTISCTQYGNETKAIKNDNKNKNKLTVNLTLSKPLSFKLDSLTTPETESICYFEDTLNNSSVKILAILNSNVNSIYYYNVDTKALLSTQRLAKNGPNGIGTATSIYIDDKDSIYVFNYSISTMFLINRSSEVIDKYSFFPNKKNNENKSICYPYPKLNSMSPMAKYGNNIYMSGYVAGEFDSETRSNRPVLIVFDVVKKATSYAFGYPDIYNETNWGGLYFRSVFMGYNPIKKILVFSFPADHYIYSTGINTLYPFVNHYAGSRNFENIRSVAKPKKFIDDDYLYDHYQQNPSYTSILYDRYRNVYYRLAQLPIKNYDTTKRKEKKQLSIIILDKDFNPIGEKLLEMRSHSQMSFFINREGFNIMKNTGNEDELVFDVFKLSKL